MNEYAGAQALRFENSEGTARPQFCLLLLLILIDYSVRIL